MSIIKGKIERPRELPQPKTPTKEEWEEQGFIVETFDEVYKKQMTRQEANLEILAKLTNIVNLNPNLRFGQILVAYNLIPSKTDLFYVESTDTLKALEVTYG